MTCSSEELWCLTSSLKHVECSSVGSGFKGFEWLDLMGDRPFWRLHHGPHLLSIFLLKYNTLETFVISLWFESPGTQNLRHVTHVNDASGTECQICEFGFYAYPALLKCPKLQAPASYNMRTELV